MMKRDIESVLLGTDELTRRGKNALISNMSIVIAVAVAVISALVSFTDVSFGAFLSDGFFPSLLFLLTNGYIIYFSLADAGENSGKESEEYERAGKKYEAAVLRIKPSDVAALGEYCIRYAEAELLQRQDAALLAAGLDRSCLEAYLKGEKTKGGGTRRLRKIAAMKPYPLTPTVLLDGERTARRSMLENPARYKLLHLFVKLIPTTVCSIITVSVMLSGKDGQSAADILNAIVRLSLLPVLAFRGYREGYLYAKFSLSAWLDTKAVILEGFAQRDCDATLMMTARSA